MRLIDADKVMEELYKAKEENEEARMVLIDNDFEMLINDAPTIDAVEVVRCKDCKWYDPPHIEYNDGSREDYPTRFVTIDEGINIGGKCTNKKSVYCCNHDREDPEDQQEIVIFRSPEDFCSYGERSEE